MRGVRRNYIDFELSGHSFGICACAMRLLLFLYSSTRVPGTVKSKMCNTVIQNIVETRADIGVWSIARQFPYDPQPTLTSGFHPKVMDATPYVCGRVALCFRVVSKSELRFVLLGKSVVCGAVPRGTFLVRGG